MGAVSPVNPWEAHPALVHFPIALLIGGVILDLWGALRRRESATRAAHGLLVAGVVTGFIAAAAGILAFYTVPAHTEMAHALMYWHGGTNAVSLVLFTWIVLVRWRRRNAPPPVWSQAVSVLATLLITVGGYLGGYMVYRGGAGVEPRILDPEIREGHAHGESNGAHQPGSEGPGEHRH
jgi:uncharacterized membrane protein